MSMMAGFDFGKIQRNQHPISRIGPMNLKNNRTVHFISNPIVFGLLLLGQGCTSITEEFTGGEREEIKPFAQQTVEVLVVEDIQIRDNELLHLRRYVDDTFVELDKLQQHMNEVRKYKDKLVEYSISLVRLTEQYDKEADRIAAYASHLEQMIGETELNRLGISTAEWSEILADIRQQETFLSALRSFQPVIVKASSDFDALVTRIENESLVATRKEFDRRIESNFSEVNELLLILRYKRKGLLGAMIALERYREGNIGAIADFRQGDARMGKILTSDTPDAEQLAVLEADIRERIEYSTLLIAEMDTDYANYVRVRAELDKIEIEILEALTIARIQVETWTRAHHALATGVKKPGELMHLTVKAARHYLVP